MPSKEETNHRKMSENKIHLESSELDLWNAYISIHNLTEIDGKFYHPEYKKLQIRTRNKIYKLGKEKFQWV